MHYVLRPIVRQNIMKQTIVILTVGLTPDLIGEFTPHLKRLADQGGMRPLHTVLPAVTCTVQSTLLTGRPPAEHGIVGNGWYFRDLAEIRFWHQSNHLVRGEKIWQAGRLRNPDFTCAKLFWWYNMYSDVDWSVTPRPVYRADGRKIPDHYAHPANLKDVLSKQFGRFPLFNFWGPATSIVATEWIAQATLHVVESCRPTLTLTYLPHLDYGLQRLGPDLTHPQLQKDLSDIDAACGLIFDRAERSGLRVIVVSEYGIVPVEGAISLNRVLRRAGLLRVRDELGREQLDAGASEAFAVTDHQVAHIYVRNQDRLHEVKALLEDLPGVEQVLDRDGKRVNGLDHPRTGDLVAISNTNKWFCYYYWLDDERAPDFARTVDIHRKPGYDPLELFMDPGIRWPKIAMASRVARQQLGFRQLMDVIPISGTTRVRGSHGRLTDTTETGPLIISSRPDLMPPQSVHAQEFKAVVLDHVFK